MAVKLEIVANGGTRPLLYAIGFSELICTDLIHNLDKYSIRVCHLACKSLGGNMCTTVLIDPFPMLLSFLYIHLLRVIHRANIRVGRDNVVMPLTVRTFPVVGNIKVESKAVYLEVVDISQS